MLFYEHTWVKSQIARTIHTTPRNPILHKLEYTPLYGQTE